MRLFGLALGLLAGVGSIFAAPTNNVDLAARGGDVVVYTEKTITIVATVYVVTVDEFLYEVKCDYNKWKKNCDYEVEISRDHC